MQIITASTELWLMMITSMIYLLQLYDYLRHKQDLHIVIYIIKYCDNKHNERGFSFW